MVEVSLNFSKTAIRGDHRVLADLIPMGSRVLDIGCGDGDLLSLLQDERQVDGRGIELSQEGVNSCVKRGLSVIQGDADTDLEDYPENAFDIVVMSQTLQATRDPEQVMKELLRIGRQVVISIPNFAHLRNRLQLVFFGRMPVTKYLPFEWYNTPNIHFCSLKDFDELCSKLNAHVEKAIPLNAGGTPLNYPAPWALCNLLANQAVYILRK